MTTPERYKRIQQLLDAVQSLPGDARRAYLAAHCGDDPELGPHVERLLTAEREAPEFLAATALEALATGVDATVDDLAGRQLGPYRVVSLLGTGGSADVYLAEDERLGRRVALKLLPSAFVSDRDRVSRFRQEARAVSALNHPNILTMHEIGEAEGRVFMVTEHIDGHTLRDRLRAGPLAVTEAIDVMMQAASALDAAHAAGIVHRDIKPENIMVRSDGYVKVVDFGLAKAVATPLGSPADERHETQPGLTMGTLQYMSPEQARGLDLDARSDIFSLGVVLHEMLTGTRPFAGATPADALAALVAAAPVSLDSHDGAIPTGLRAVVRRCLDKNPAARYATARALRDDLEALSQGEPAESPSQATAPLRDSRERIRRARARVASGGLILVVAAMLAGAWGIWRRPVSPVVRDSVLLADFTNSTGDAVFDRTLKHALAVLLEQSPFLSVFPDERARQTLRFMGRSPDERITPALARDISQRNGVKALLSADIAQLGSSYVITLEAVDSASGEVIARGLVEAVTKDDVLAALGRGTTPIRAKLGESLGSIRRFDAPIEQVTTRSLDALRAYALGRDQAVRGQSFEAIPFFARAVELDPNFASAHAHLSTAYLNVGNDEQARSFSERAYALRGTTSEREGYYIGQQYFRHVLGDLDKAIEVLEMWKRAYPNDHIPLGNLALCYMMTGQFAKAADEARHSLRLDPANAAAHVNLAFSLLALDERQEARGVFDSAVKRRVDSPSIRMGIDAVTLLDAGPSAMRGFLASARGTPYESIALNWEASVAAAFGQLRLARTHTSRAIDLALRVDEGRAGRYRFEASMRHAAYGQCDYVADLARDALPVTTNKWFLSGLAVSLSLCGRSAEAITIIDDLTARHPDDTLVNLEARPVVLAAVEIARNRPQRAIDILTREGAHYERGTYALLWPAYVRGLAYLRLGRADEAGAEFRALVDSKGLLLTHTFAPPLGLAHLGLARAAALAGDAASARDAYATLLRVWASADRDVPVIAQAHREASRLP